MTTITISDVILFQIQPGEQAVEVCDATGRVVGLIPLPQSSWSTIP